MNLSTFKLLTLSALMFLITGGLTAAVLYWQETKAATLIEQMRSVQSQVELKRNHAVLEEERTATAEERERLQSLVITGEKGTIEFLAKLDELAAKEGVVINTTELKVEKTSEGGFDDLVGSFKLSGEGRSIQRVLRQLELIPYASEIDRLTLSRAGSASEASVVLRVSIFE